MLLFSLLIVPIWVLGQVKDMEKGRSYESGKSITDLDLKKDFDTQIKILKKNKKLIVLRGALHFKTIDVGAARIGKGQGATNSVSYAILEGVSETTKKEITQAYHDMLVRKLTALGYSFVDQNQLETSNKYEFLSEKAYDNDMGNKTIGRYQVATAGNYPVFKPAMGNMSVYQASLKMSKQLDVPLLSFDAIIDFARFDIDAKRWKTPGYGPGYDFQTTRSDVNILPQIGIQSYNGMQMNPISSGLSLTDENGRYDFVHLKKNMYVVENYATDIDTYQGKMPESMKRIVTINQQTTGTFVVKADEEKYKRLVLEALDAFSDYLIASIEAKI